ncbi:hypothetical protein AQUSIP_06820 [Aquicella siphonis]|uniref:Uncharacterized protein n=1 Tax=Aquicella siphonis TaxID=254247 RepID=A0A5E4PFU0_9COXI|nr:hypothetical protein [Aquicella siphonis]VVC75392.1 hypothetical protein AQUSIP_06820 [Aquicella siphonis]
MESSRKDMAGFDTSLEQVPTTSVHVHTNSEFNSDKLLVPVSNQSCLGFFGSVIKRISKYSMLYDFFITADIHNQKETTTYTEISDAQMLDTNLDDIADDQLFQLGIARKLCLSLPMTVHHASLAFRSASGEFLIIGRQNAQFLKSPDSNASSFAWWLVTHINLSAIYNFTDTHMGNEKKYEFFPGSFFDAEMTDVILSGAEIKKLVKDAEEDICSQRYDVVHSNCYSAVFYGLTKAVDLIAARAGKGQGQGSYEALKSIFTIISSAFQDNHRLGLGGIDNDVIVKSLANMIKKLERLGLLEVMAPAGCAEISTRCSKRSL